MLQISKVLRSRDTWKRTTIECRYKLRESRKTEKRHLKKIAELKLENRELKQLVEDEKKHQFSLIES
ncbi:MAG: hypothetical protein GQ529_03245 [Methyloprofundus sp.]|nr:hypothetical protein [Methyloprofundus sp.]